MITILIYKRFASNLANRGRFNRKIVKTKTSVHLIKKQKSNNAAISSLLGAINTYPSSAKWMLNLTVCNIERYPSKICSFC